MANYNYAAICGRITRDPEIKSTNSGKVVCQFTVAVGRPKTQHGDMPTADFINCVAWDHSAEYLARYAARGTLLLVSGRIQTRSYDGRDGQKKYVTEIIARDVQILTSKDQSQASSQKYDYGSSHGTDIAPDQIDRDNPMPGLPSDLPF